MALPAFDKIQNRVAKVFETTGTIDEWLSEFTEEELSNAAVVDGEDNCECHNFRSKAPIIKSCSK